MSKTALITGITGGSPQAGSPGLQLDCSPNPCRDHLSLNYAGDAGMTVELAVFDLSGRLVRSLGSRVLDGSAQNVVWYGFDDSGECVPAGVYICRLSAPSGLVMRKVTLLR